ncbi:uncharacterized protein LOC143017622 [Oratosquilla oratoria]|uniref:uncharacterized protein LOC143017622 n=1 Tax=Oratosquilla oratoria TaxID=337810 RepID=UPI003F7708D0
MTANSPTRYLPSTSARFSAATCLPDRLSPFVCQFAYQVCRLLVHLPINSTAVAACQVCQLPGRLPTFSPTTFKEGGGLQIPSMYFGSGRPKMTSSSDILLLLVDLTLKKFL